MSLKHLFLAVAVLFSLVPLAAQAEPTACWHFDEGSGTVAADACGGHDGTLHPGASWSRGMCETALFLDGANGYVSVPNGPGLDGMAEMTVEAWIYLFNYPWLDRDVLIAGIWGPGYTDDDAFKFSVAPDGRLMLEVSDGNPEGLPNDEYISQRSSLDAIPLNRWVHVCATFQPDLAPPYDPIRLYVDFVDNSGDYYPGTGQQTRFVHDTTQELWMGTNEVGHHLNAIIDELEIHDSVVTPTPSCPLAAWMFEGPCGGPIPDETGQGHDLAPVNCAGLATRQDGLGQAASFDGVDDRYEAPDTWAFCNLSWVIIEAEVFPIAPIPYRNLGVVTLWGPGLTEDDGFFLVYQPDGRLWGAIQGSSRVDVLSAAPLPLLTWSRVRMIYDGAVLSLYVNDTLVGSAEAPVGLLNCAGVPLYVGRNDFDAQSPGTFWGYIDDVAIYGQAVDPAGAPDPAPAKQVAVSALPNPVNDSATVRFELPRRADVTLEIFDLQGRLVRTLPAGILSPGAHQLNWDARDQQGHAVGSGQYLLRLRDPEGVIVNNRVTVLR